MTESMPFHFIKQLWCRLSGLRVLIMVIMSTKLHGLRRAAGSIQVTQGPH